MVLEEEELTPESLLQDYDVMGWRRDELIHDVLDQYQRHMHFLSVVR